MANDGKFLNLTGGVPTQESANATSAGAGDAGKLIKLDAGGKIDPTLLPAGVGPEARSMIASEALVAGDIVNVWNDAGVSKMRKADAGATLKEADGFVLAGVGSGASGTLYPEEAVVTGLTGMTPGARQFLSSSTPGARTETAPSTATHHCQIIGKALSATEMLFRPETPIKLA